MTKQTTRFELLRAVLLLDQVWQFIPTDGLPPWRDPGPGEPGWEPILNYCEVEPDEQEVMEVRRVATDLPDHVTTYRAPVGYALHMRVATSLVRTRREFGVYV